MRQRERVGRDVFVGLYRGCVISLHITFIYRNKGGKNPSPPRNTSPNRK